MKFVMEIKNYKKRIADSKIEHFLMLFGAISIEGPNIVVKLGLDVTIQIVKFFYKKLQVENQIM